MFLRRYERRSGGGRRTYWALVESVRTGRGSRQRVVAYLGELKRSEQSGWAQLGRSFRASNGRSGRCSIRRITTIRRTTSRCWCDLRGVRLERLRDFGDVWMALGLWRLLGLDALLQSLAEPGREEVPWPVVAAILTIARFCKPSERTAHRDDVVSRHGLGGLVGRVGGEGSHRPAVRGLGLAAAAQVGRSRSI